jgi:ribosomal protein S18 acetylase RimI-like enzyme
VASEPDPEQAQRRDAPFEILPAGTQHEAFVRELSTEVFTRYGDYRRMLPRAMRLRSVRTVVVAHQGDPVAFAMFELLDPAGPTVDLTAIAVLPAWQGRGIGRLLLDHVERAVRELGRGREASLTATVAEDNAAARHLFDRWGFRRIEGEAGIYPRGQRALALCKLLEA